ncbi:DUF2752 domain-containing protein [Kribbella sp. NPDC051936]|uniref:DUF2752 domain-containing protein n=1 Tax=Kribbella sp. NPDC051936 TaxID=3154946 RepID=UPI00343D8F71
MTFAATLRRPGPVKPVDRRVWGLAGVGIGGFALAGIYRLTGLGVPCPLHTLTGLDCPFCGATRMAAALLEGDLNAAWHFNAAVLVLGPLIGVAIGYEVLAWSLARAGWLSLPRPRLSPRAVSVLTKVALGALLLFGVLRNV